MQEPACLLVEGFPGHICLPRDFLTGGSLVSSPSGSALFLFPAMTPGIFGCCGEYKDRKSSGTGCES